MQMIISSIVGTSKIYPLYLCASLVSTSPSKPIVVDRIPRMSFFNSLVNFAGSP